MALEATLRSYLDPEKAFREVETLKMLVTELAQILDRAAAIVKSVQEGAPHWTVEVVETKGQVGSGSMPTEVIPSAAVGIAHPHPNRLSEALRASRPPVFGRVHHDRVLLDLRTVHPSDDEILTTILSGLAATENADTGLTA